MLLFIVFLLSLVLGITLCVLGWIDDNYCDNYGTGFERFLCAYSEELLTIGIIITILFLIGTIVLGFIAGISSSDSSLNEAREYDSLMSRMDTEKGTLAYKLQVEEYNAKIDKAIKDSKDP